MAKGLLTDKNLVEISDIPLSMGQSSLSMLLRDVSESVVTTPLAVRKLQSFEPIASLVPILRKLIFSNPYQNHIIYCILPAFLAGCLEKMFIMGVDWRDVSPSTIDQRDIFNLLGFISCFEEGIPKSSEVFTLTSDDGLVVVKDSGGSVVFTLPAEVVEEKGFEW